MKVKSLKVLLAAMMVSLIVSGVALGGTTGKISGVVVDAETKEPLPGAMITILGTPMGANTDIDGRYSIINIAVGTYSVKANMMGYEPQTITGLKAIMDLTTTVNFRLKPTIIEMEGTVVTGQRDAMQVRADITSTTKTVSTKEIENMAGVRSYADVVSKQSGVVSSEGGSSGATSGAHIRGGRSNEIAYFVDGLSTQDQVVGGSGAQINTNAIQEVMVITGGFNAEYGQAMSGVVNVVTKSGSSKHEGMLRYATNGILPKEDVLNRGYHGIEANVGGPVPLLKDFKYFVSGEINRYAYDREMYFYPNTQREFYSGQAKLTMDKSFFKVTLGGFVSRTQRGRNEGWSVNHDFDYNSAHKRSTLQKSQQFQATITHMLSKDAFYTANLAYFMTKTTNGVRKYNKEGYEGWFSDYEFKEFYARKFFTNPNSPLYNGDTTDGYATYYTSDPTLNPYGINGFFVGGDFPFPSQRQSEYALGKVDFTTQLNKLHQLKAGAETKFNKIKFHSVSYPASSDIREDGTVYYLFSPDDYTYYPFQANGYVQDKMEFKGMIVNVGVRMDLLSAHAKRPVDYEVLTPMDPLDPNAAHIEFVDSKAKYKISPRLGISFPISEKTAFRFSYGHFFQSPDLQYLYADINNTASQAVTRLGNPDLNAQQTVAFEIGLQHQFSQSFLMNLTSYYKDIYHLLGQENIVLPSGNYYLYKDTEYGNVKGAEIQLNMQFTRMLSGNASYGLSVAKGSSSWVGELSNYQYFSGTDWVPVQDYYLEFDQRHNLMADISLNTEKGDGPKLFGVRPLENFSVNLSSTLASGLPYTRTTSKGKKLEITNSSRMPWTTSTNLRLSRSFSIWRLNYNLVAEIENLFNNKNVNTVYSNTGDPIDNGALAGGLLEQYRQPITRYLDNDPRSPNPYYNYRADLNHDDYVSAEEHYYAALKSNEELSKHGANGFPYGVGRELRLFVSVNF
ncbi:TonB-dependent receptor [candidate division TA06 bacterium]|nr:TonB-dependent receptor [candidate division TA06 bacterium]